MLPQEQADELQARGMARIHDEIRSRLEQFREQELREADAAPVTEVRVVEDRPANAILEQAESCGADLIVMGTHGRTGVSELVLGSVAYKVIQRSKRPVLLVPLRE